MSRIILFRSRARKNITSAIVEHKVKDVCKEQGKSIAASLLKFRNCRYGCGPSYSPGIPALYYSGDFPMCIVLSQLVSPTFIRDLVHFDASQSEELALRSG
ncbi:hypothetical protein RRG08_039853 [Elysia crispata]|uniref:Uncharacterized protein n=1 Tax=Elysia crispata TaxID=231223 RepID=A0AAE1DNT7_9GAST|nr:hypothetical protein RRG08_039853 [Elysia crispata]